eukprot:889370-Amphidinium_carterae.1
MPSYAQGIIFLPLPFQPGWSGLHFIIDINYDRRHVNKKVLVCQTPSSMRCVQSTSQLVARHNAATSAHCLARHLQRMEPRAKSMLLLSVPDTKSLRLRCHHKVRVHKHWPMSIFDVSTSFVARFYLPALVQVSNLASRLIAPHATQLQVHVDTKAGRVS